MASAPVLQDAVAFNRHIMLEYKRLMEEPAEGFRVKLGPDENLFNWIVIIFGPPMTLFKGGYFKAEMIFPLNYPHAPPSFRFLTKMWHPNIYDSGEVCISVLHPPGDDPVSGELASERWNSKQNARTIILSVISLLDDPNTFSPANVDASAMYKRWKETNGRDKDYENMIRKVVQASKEEALKDAVEVPVTLESYCLKAKHEAHFPRFVTPDEELSWEEGYFEEDNESSLKEILHKTNAKMGMRKGKKKKKMVKMGRRMKDSLKMRDHDI